MTSTGVAGPLLAFFFSSAVWGQAFHENHGNLSIISASGLYEVFDPTTLETLLSKRIPLENETILAGHLDGEVILTLSLAKNGTAFIGRTNLSSNFSLKVQVLDKLKGDPSSYGQMCFYDGGLLLVKSGENIIYDLNTTTLRLRTFLDAQTKVKSIAYDETKKVLYYATDDSIVQFDATSLVTSLKASGLIVASGLSLDKEKDTLYWISKADKRRRIHTSYKIEYLRLNGATRPELFCNLNSIRPISADYLVSSGDQLFVADVHGTFWKADRTENQECKPRIIRHLTSDQGKPASLEKLTSISVGQQNTTKDQGKPASLEKLTSISVGQQNTTKADPDPCKDFCPSNSKLAASICEVDENGNPFCKCPVGYEGDLCEINLCSNFCKNDGLCFYNNVSQKPSCICNLGFSGENCEESLCDGHCFNNATCTIDDQTAKPKCLCPPQFYGDQCSELNQSSTCSGSPYDYFNLFILFLIISLILSVALILTILKQGKRPLSRPILVRKNPETKTFGFKPNTKAVSERPLLSCTNHSIVLDLEECCQMTICDEPCPEAIFRKPTSVQNQSNVTHSDLAGVFSEDKTF